MNTQTKETKGSDIIIISVDPWQEERWARKQMFAWLLAQKYRNVFYYIEPGRSERTLPLFKRLKSNLYLIDVPHIPKHLQNGRISSLSVKLSCASLWLLLKLKRVKNPIFIVYQPHNMSFAKKLSSIFGKSLICYDMTDDWSEFPGISEHRKHEIISEESRVIKEADLVFAVSGRLFDKAVKLNPNSIHLPNATDFESFNKVMSNIDTSEEIRSFNRPRLGYVGNITPRRIDFELLRFIAESKPEWNIIMIGPVHAEAADMVNSFRDLRNVFFLGPKKYYSLPEYIKGFDICILPHRVDNLTQSMDPIKLYDYMATGKPIVATAVAEAVKFREEICLGNSREEFVSHIKSLLYEGATEQSLAMQLETAKKNTWDKRVEKLTEIFQEKLNEIR
mgnify:FL=1